MTRLKKWQQYSWLMMPRIIAVLLLAVMTLPLPFYGKGSVMPMLLMVWVFYWALYAPIYLPGWFVFLLGILFDVVFALPPGLTAVLLLLTYMSVLVIKRVIVMDLLWVLGGFFAFFSLMLLMGYFGLIALSSGGGFDMINSLTSWGLTVILFFIIIPLTHGLRHKLEEIA